MIGELYTRKHADRLTYLNKAEFQFSEFIKFMTCFLLPPKHLLEIFQKIRDSTKYVTTRDEKIKLYKELNS